MIIQENDKIIRVNKTKARILFNRDYKIYMMGNKTRLDNIWVEPHIMNREISFDTNINHFEYYLDPELGNYTAFYINKKVR